MLNRSIFFQLKRSSGKPSILIWGQTGHHWSKPTPPTNQPEFRKPIFVFVFVTVLYSIVSLSVFESVLLKYAIPGWHDPMGHFQPPGQNWLPNRINFVTKPDIYTLQNQRNTLLRTIEIYFTVPDKYTLKNQRNTVYRIREIQDEATHIGKTRVSNFQRDPSPRAQLAR